MCRAKRVVFMTAVIFTAFFIFPADILFAGVLKPVKKAVIKANRVQARKKYEYTKSHDYNNDGVVNAKDRLIWLKRQEDKGPTVYVSTENDDLLEAMDYNDDGNVTSTEMALFYEQYDTNHNGILEDVEIEQATD